MKNDYEIRGEVTAIILKSKKYGTMETLISTEKLEKAMEFKFTWCALFTRYGFYCSGKNHEENGGKSIQLHRFITNCPEGYYIDHINHNTLDNTDSNIRIVTCSQNQQNRLVGKNSKSGVIGVYWLKRERKWQAKLKLNGKNIYFGQYSDKEDAVSAIKKARAELMPFSIPS